MNFSFHDFIMSGLRSAIGNMPDYKIILNATNWFEKEVLVENDLAEIQALIDEKNAPAEEFESEEPLE